MAAFLPCSIVSCVVFLPCSIAELAAFFVSFALAAAAPAAFCAAVCAAPAAFCAWPAAFLATPAAPWAAFCAAPASLPASSSAKFLTSFAASVPNFTKSDFAPSMTWPALRASSSAKCLASCVFSSAICAASFFLLSKRLAVFSPKLLSDAAMKLKFQFNKI